MLLDIKYHLQSIHNDFHTFILFLLKEKLSDNKHTSTLINVNSQYWFVNMFFSNPEIVVFPANLYESFI